MKSDAYSALEREEQQILKDRISNRMNATGGYIASFGLSILAIYLNAVGSGLDTLVPILIGSFSSFVLSSFGGVANDRNNQRLEEIAGEKKSLETMLN